MQTAFALSTPLNTSRFTSTPVAKRAASTTHRCPLHLPIVYSPRPNVTIPSTRTTIIPLLPSLPSSYIDDDEYEQEQQQQQQYRTSPQRNHVNSNDLSIIGNPWMMASPDNIAKKASKVEAAQELLNQSLLLVCAPLDGMTVQQVSTLKQRMPEGTKIVTVKNTLMRRALSGTSWEVATDLTQKSSFWLFIKDDMKGSIKAYNEYMKEISREAPIRGGVFEGELYDTQGVDKVAALPSKKELITKIAISIKAMPTKIARSVKAVPSKLGRAVKLAFAEEEGGEDGAKGGDSPQ